MLKEQIIKLYELVNGKEPSSTIKYRIEEILNENDLNNNEKVPGWFTELLNCLITGNTKERTFYESEPLKGDTSNLIAELEDIIDAEWIDYGEAVEGFFPTLELYVCISTEGSFFEVKHLHKNNRNMKS